MVAAGPEPGFLGLPRALVTLSPESVGLSTQPITDPVLIAPVALPMEAGYGPRVIRVAMMYLQSKKEESAPN